MYLFRRRASNSLFRIHRSVGQTIIGFAEDIRDVEIFWQRVAEQVLCLGICLAGRTEAMINLLPGNSKLSRGVFVQCRLGRISNMVAREWDIPHEIANRAEAIERF